MDKQILFDCPPILREFLFYMETMLLETLSMLSGLTDANNQQLEDGRLNAGGNLSKDAKKELYLQNQDKGYEH